MLKNVNIKSITKNVGTLAIYIVMTLTVMCISGEIYNEFYFDEGIITGFRTMIKEFTKDDGYVELVWVICIAYCYERLTRKVMNIFKRKEKKEES